MNCIHCKRELPADYRVSYCPFCGRDLVDENASESLPTGLGSGIWPKFFIVLFAPAVFCFAAMALGLGDLAAIVGIFGSVAAGIVSARILMAKLEVTGFQRAVMHFFIAIVLCGLSIFVTAIGCGLGVTATGNHF